MGKINGCLKCLFIFFNVVFVILGCGLIYLAVRATAMSIQQMSSVGVPGVGWIWVVAIGILGISSLGIYAACSENELALKIFAGFMGIGMLIMLIFGIIVAVQRNQIKSAFQSTSNELVVPFMKDENFKQMLDAMQSTFKCCGIVSAEDWGNEIPVSCDCSSSNTGLGTYDNFGFGSSGCKSKPQGASGPAKVYDQSCGDVIFSVVDIFFKVAMGFLFGFAVTALLGLLITLFMIHQVKRNDNGGSIAMKSY
ncbi:tetraspanin-8-like [Archocentrus centrarchus]|uniref:tetraspanin-8-like n=1 Tax=Archocentrus centrarchus TaxID=63155 RepID=UPI0011E9E509|nr:tetraspanin-8-like [Archocentrus centrarchus]